MPVPGAIDNAEGEQTVVSMALEIDVDITVELGVVFAVA